MFRAISTKAFYTLRGQVRSFDPKQVAQELIRRVDGAEEVNNHLEVVAPPCLPWKQARGWPEHRCASGCRECPSSNRKKRAMSTATATTLSAAELDRLWVDAIRFLSVDAVQKANSGHPGLPLGAAPMAYVLWIRFLRHNPANPRWFNRDRFVLSAGHGSMLLYAAASHRL